MSRVKFQHYVPRFYLEKFTQNGKISVFDKSSEKTYSLNPARTAGESFFYDVPDVDHIVGVDQFVEKFISNIEGATAGILNKWLRKLDAGAFFKIYNEERQQFSIFLAVQFLRTPTHRTRIVQMISMLKNIERNNTPSEANANPAGDHLNPQVKRDAETTLHASAILNVDHIKEMAEIFLNHIWIVEENNTKIPFYTSDNPVCIKPNKKAKGWRSFSGIASPGIQIMFPLSSRFSLSLLDRNHFDTLKALDGKKFQKPLPPENITYNNYGQIFHSSRFLFTSFEKAFEFATEICRMHPELKDPTRTLVTSSHPSFSPPKKPFQ